MLCHYANYVLGSFFGNGAFRIFSFFNKIWLLSHCKGVFVPVAISFALLLLPAVISAQVFGVLEVYDFDDSVEVAGIVFGILSLMHMLQISLKQSFTVGESYIVSALTVSAFYASIFYSGEVKSDYTSTFISVGSAAACATGFMLYTGECRADKDRCENHDHQT